MAVYELADNPSEESFRLLIELYEKYGYPHLLDEAKYALRSIKVRIERSNINFSQALVDLHHDLMVGNIGCSPFVATSIDMGMTQEFTGKVGMVSVSSLNESQISKLRA